MSNGEWRMASSAGAAARWAPLLAAACALALLGCSEDKGSGLGKDFSYDLTELRKVDPKLLRYGEAREIALPFKEPRALAVDAKDRVYVAGDEAVAVFDGEGQREAEFTVGGAPRALAVAADGTLYAAMKDHVEVFDATGGRRAAWESLGEKALLTSIAVGEDGVFVADAGSRVVVRCDGSGKVLGLLGRKDAERDIPGLVVPSPHLDVAMSREGLLWVVNPGRHRLEAYTADGHLELSWGKASAAIEGFSGCCNPTDIAILPDGGFVTAEKGMPRVKVYSHEGKFEGVVAAPDRFDRNVVGLDLAVDSRGRVLVLDPAAKKVRVFVRKGT